MVKTIFVACGFIMAASMSHSATVTDNFDGPVQIGDGSVAGDWSVDRYEPAGFEQDAFAGGSLRLDTSSDDAQVGFTATQGYRQYLQPNSFRTSIDFFLDSSFASGPDGRVAGFWATAWDSDDAAAAYGIIEYAQNYNGFTGFQIWDIVNGSFITIDDVTIEADTWYSLDMRVNENNKLVYFINGERVLSQTIAPPSDGRDFYFGDAIVQGYNNADGIDRSFYFDNFQQRYDALPDLGAPGAGDLAPVPVPAALPLLGAGLFGLTVIRRRKRKSTEL